MPKPIITENQVYLDLQNAEHLLHQLHERRINSLIFPGPPGVGKSFTAEKIAAQHHAGWCPERPGTAVGMLSILHEYSLAQSLLTFDDLDSVFEDSKTLQILMVAFDTKARRVVSHTVGGHEHSFGAFEIKYPVLFLSNLDFDDDKILKRNGMKALKSRSIIAPVTHDPTQNYYYAAWLSTDGGMLDSIRVDFPTGRVLHREGQEPLVITSRNKRQRLTRQEKNDVLEHFHTHARRYPSISAREIYKYAKLRLGEAKDVWLRMVDGQLSRTARWQRPANLHRFRIEQQQAEQPDPESPPSGGGAPMQRPWAEGDPDPGQLAQALFERGAAKRVRRSLADTMAAVAGTGIPVIKTE